MGRLARPSVSKPRERIRPDEPSAQEVRELNLVMGGFAFFQALVTGAKFDIFSRLSARPGRSLEQVAVDLKIKPYAARVLLLGLCSAGLLQRVRGKYRNARVTEKFLVRGATNCLLPAVDAYHELIYRSFFHLTDSVRQQTNVGLQEFPGEGNTLYKRLANRPTQERIFQDWLHMVSAQSNAALEALPTLAKARHLLDVGGGDATNGISLSRAFPGMKVTVFDLPSVCQLAEKNIQSAGFGELVTTLPGDFLTDPFPKGPDAILFGHLLNIFSPERNLTLLRRAYRALPKGGTVICFNSMTDDDEMGPPRSALLSLYFLTLASGEGMVYPWKDYVAWFKQAGFRNVRVRRMDDIMDHGVVVGTK